MLLNQVLIIRFDRLVQEFEVYDEEDDVDVRVGEYFFGSDLLSIGEEVGVDGFEVEEYL